VDAAVGTLSRLLRGGGPALGDILRQLSVEELEKLSEDVSIAMGEVASRRTYPLGSYYSPIVSDFHPYREAKYVLKSVENRVRLYRTLATGESSYWSSSYVTDEEVKGQALSEEQFLRVTGGIRFRAA
jgi:hypothetical protein